MTAIEPVRQQAGSMGRGEAQALKVHHHEAQGIPWDAASAQLLGTLGQDSNEDSRMPIYTNS